MKNELTEYRVKLNKFNSWEIEYSKNLSIKNRLDQFEELFNLAYELPEDVKDKGHIDHLNNLISIKKRLRKYSLETKGNK